MAVLLSDAVKVVVAAGIKTVPVKIPVVSPAAAVTAWITVIIVVVTIIVSGVYIKTG